MIGDMSAPAGADTRSWRSVPRPGLAKVTGATEMTAAGAPEAGGGVDAARWFTDLPLSLGRKGINRIIVPVYRKYGSLFRLSRASGEKAGIGR
ncbi:hypothetical protein [Phenylobacterium sp.]|uniref:hypothetical protein n=1 Tax=Phenylobacterium sp. TaxID=1871053 RepID=UPI0035B063ED